MYLYIHVGTRTIGFFEGEDPNAESAFLMAVKESVSYNNLLLVYRLIPLL